MQKALFRALPFVAAILLLASCGNYSKILKTNDFDYKYEMAKQYYAEGQYNRAALLFQEVIAMMKGTDKGEESLYMLAMSHYRAKNYSAAASVFKKFYESYPRGYWVEEARFYSGKSLYMDTPEPKLDQSATYDAIAQFQNFMDLYPESDLREKAQEMIFALQDKLVEKEYLSAKLYYDLGSYFGNCTNGGSNYQACIVTAENALKDYPYSTRREDFSILLLRAKFELARESVDDKKEERYHDAIDEYYGFTNEYPESKYMAEAKKLFESASSYASTDENE